MSFLFFCSWSCISFFLFCLSHETAGNHSRIAFDLQEGWISSEEAERNRKQVMGSFISSENFFEQKRGKTLPLILLQTQDTDWHRKEERSSKCHWGREDETKRKVSVDDAAVFLSLPRMSFPPSLLYSHLCSWCNFVFSAKYLWWLYIYLLSYSFSQQALVTVCVSLWFKWLNLCLFLSTAYLLHTWIEFWTKGERKSFSFFIPLQSLCIPFFQVTALFVAAFIFLRLDNQITFFTFFSFSFAFDLNE